MPLLCKQRFRKAEQIPQNPLEYRYRPEAEGKVLGASEWINNMTEPKDHVARKIDEKLHKLIKRAKKQRGMLWSSVVSKLELARADIKAMTKVYESGP
jgi:hypothetical protein